MIKVGHRMNRRPPFVVPSILLGLLSFHWALCEMLHVLGSPCLLLTTRCISGSGAKRAPSDPSSSATSPRVLPVSQVRESPMSASSFLTSTFFPESSSTSYLYQNLQFPIFFRLLNLVTSKIWRSPFYLSSAHICWFLMESCLILYLLL